MTVNYLVATIKPWNLEAFHAHVDELPGEWHLVTDKEELTVDLVDELSPRYVFFPHWSWIVPAEILARSECVCFHMTDVPYGRGGSPLQNLIVRGHRHTKLTALRMTEAVDAGPVYSKKPLSLEGTGQEILERAAGLVYEAIEEIVRTEPQPTPQRGEVTRFERRIPDMSRLPRQGALEDLHDHIRMLDIDTYPRAFLDYGEYRLTFRDATLEDGALKAEVEIRPRGPEDRS